MRMALNVPNSMGLTEDRMYKKDDLLTKVTMGTFYFRATPIVLGLTSGFRFRDHFWLCAGDYVWCWGSKPGHLHARQVSYMLYISSTPNV